MVIFKQQLVVFSLEFKNRTNCGCVLSGSYSSEMEK
jgi:hypothetical protein